jgi:hypothetical protein
MLDTSAYGTFNVEELAMILATTWTIISTDATVSSEGF